MVPYLPTDTVYPTYTPVSPTYPNRQALIIDIHRRNHRPMSQDAAHRCSRSTRAPHGRSVTRPLRTAAEHRLIARGPAEPTPPGRHAASRRLRRYRSSPRWPRRSKSRHYKHRLLSPLRWCGPPRVMTYWRLGWARLGRGSGRKNRLVAGLGRKATAGRRQTGWLAGRQEGMGWY